MFLALQTAAQKPGTLKTEAHPSLTVSTCTVSGGCTTENKSVTIDQNWRWLHETGETHNCYTGNLWSDTLCSNVTECISNCAVEGADEEYAETYGVNATGDALELGFVTTGQYSRNVGSRTFLMEDEENYKMFMLKNKEFTFDVDVTQLPCGLNGALYFVQMDADGGKAKYPTNTAGAKYGTGYCDAQCPHDLKWINGEPNLLDWVPSSTDANAGTGRYGTCCVEMDIWEANIISTAYTAHSCAVGNQTRCEGVDCGDNASGDRFNGVCDKNGCDLQTYRLNNKTFYGNGTSFELDSSKPMTVVTQFITADNTDTGALKEIRRFYKQGSKIVHTPTLAVGSYGSYSSLSTDYCTAEKNYFADGTNFLEKGGMSSMDDAMEKGMVLVMSIWDDHDVNMLWLDSTYPVNGTSPGDARGTCNSSSGVPATVERVVPDSKVTYSNIKIGEIGSTTLDRRAEVAATPLRAAAPKTATKWGACTAALPCPTGWECAKRDGFAQCVPTKALSEAFAKTKPSAKAMADFVATGKTNLGSLV